METYQALDITTLFNVNEMRANNISCWLLYQTNEENGSSVHLFSALTRIRIKNVLPETLGYILYKEGEYYKRESLADQVESNRLNMEQLLLKAGFDITVSEELLEEYKNIPIPWYNPNKKEIYEMIADDSNGYCVFYPIERIRSKGPIAAYYRDGVRVRLEHQIRGVEVCYRPDTKKLHNGFLDKIFCKINLGII